MHWIIDRTEEDKIAVLESLANGEIKEVPLADLPRRVRVGDALLFNSDNLTWAIDEEKTAAMKKLIADKWAKLKQRKINNPN